MEIYLELVLSIVGVVKDTVGCTDDKLTNAGMVNDDEAIRVLIIVILVTEGIKIVYSELVLSLIGVVEDTVGCTDDELSMVGMIDNDETN